MEAPRARVATVPDFSRETENQDFQRMVAGEVGPTFPSGVPCHASPF